jgi:hypothetical protein
VVDDVPVGESDDAITASGQPFGASGIVLGLDLMRIAIDFHDQAAVGTAEIYDEPAYGVLASELVTELPIT